MNERVAQYLENKRAQEKMDCNNPKTKMLVDLGLYDLVFYSDKSPYDTSSSLWVYRTDAEPTGWYMKKVVDITDEEYKELLKYYNPDDMDNIKVGKSICSWSTAIMIINALACSVGTVVGIVDGNILLIALCVLGIIATAFYTKLIKGFGILVSDISKINKKI